MALPVRKGYKGAPAQAVLTNSPTSGDTTFVVDTITGWATTFPFYCVVEPGTSKEEKVKVTAISTLTLTVVRAQDDTTASGHNAGAAIYPVFTADEADEANEIASVMTTKGDLIATNGSSINRLGVGTNTHVLQADSTATNGFKWGQIVEAGIADSAVTSAKIAVGTIVNDDINALAAIAHSKLANATAGQVLLGTTTTGVVTATALSGDVTVTGAGVTAIGAGVIVAADIADGAVDKAKIGSGPRGVVAYAKSTTTSGTIDTTSAIQLTSTSFTAVSGRYYKITYHEPQVGLTASVASCSILSQIKLSGGALTLYQQSISQAETTSNNFTITTSVYLSNLSGSMAVTGNLQALTLGGGTPTCIASRGTDYPAYLLVEDMGTV